MRDLPQVGETWEGSSITCRVMHVVPHGDVGNERTAVVYHSYSTGKLHWRTLDNFCLEFEKTTPFEQVLPTPRTGRRKLCLSKTQNESEPTL